MKCADRNQTQKSPFTIRKRVGARLNKLVAKDVARAVPMAGENKGCSWLWYLHQNLNLGQHVGNHLRRRSRDQYGASLVPTEALTHWSAIKATNGLYIGAWFGIMSHEARRAQL
jgi:hypothetical protein